MMGLGNPGSRYRRTRHNLGFRVVDLLAAEAHEAFEREPRAGDTCWTARIALGSEGCVLAKPRTFMNRSGRAAAALLAGLGCAPGDLLVVHDDADLELGRVRIRLDGSAGGHNGIRSLIDALRTTDFPRVRLGVRGEGREDLDLAEYVLSEFLEAESEAAERLVELGAQAVRGIVEHGIEPAMNLYNGLKPVAGEGPR